MRLQSWQEWLTIYIQDKDYSCIQLIHLNVQDKNYFLRAYRHLSGQVLLESGKNLIIKINSMRGHLKSKLFLSIWKSTHQTRHSSTTHLYPLFAISTYSDLFRGRLSCLEMPKISELTSRWNLILLNSEISWRKWGSNLWMKWLCKVHGSTFRIESSTRKVAIRSLGLQLSIESI